jgi:diguanylate cyclase (GGDEF)-like protein
MADSVLTRSWRWLASSLPRGNRLPENAWETRHRAIVAILWLHAGGILGYALHQAASPASLVLATLPVVVITALATVPRLPRRMRAALATLAALFSSTALVQLSGGLIEAHFHFFVMVFVITFYQDWTAFLLAIGFVVVEHAIVGVVAPHSVYNHAEAWAHPVRWAIIHALFLSGAAAAAVVNWSLNERAQVAERAIAGRLAFEASHDPLTGTLNRREFDRQVSMLLGDPRDAVIEHAVCLMDLDQFKIVNDSSGHAAGDEVLRQVTGLIQSRMSANDQLARIGGDEFAVLLADRGLTDAAAFAEDLRTVVCEHRFAVAGRIFSIGLSAGVVALDPVNDPDGVDALGAADAACYAAKEGGRNRVHVVTANDEQFARQQGQAHWAERLQAAIYHDDLVLYYQPIEATDPSRRECYGELLVRMRDDDGSLISPGVFLPAAERYNLVGTVDRWVVQAVCTALAGRYEPGVEPSEQFSINLSGVSLGDLSMLTFIREQLDRHGIPPSAISFEVTETVAINDLTAAIAFITELKNLGCSFALDDFGSGLSSFSYLKKLPVDIVKIDGSFVRGITTDPVDRAMVEAVNRISQEMGLRTVAEFVESEAIMNTLRVIGVDYGQGWALGRPEPFDGWLVRNAPPRRYSEHLATLSPAHQ